MFRERIKKTVIEIGPKQADYYKHYLEGARHIFLVNTRSNELEGKSIDELAKKHGIKPLDLFFDIVFQVSPIIPKNINAGLVAPFHCGSKANIVEASNHPSGMPCIDVVLDPSDPSFCPGPYMFGSFPKFFCEAMAYGVSVEEAVRKMSSLPARRLGLWDRGMLLKGFKADITVFDPDEYRTDANYDNPTATAKGVKYTIVNGAITLDDGESIGLRAGKMLLKTD
jgi:N-acyl-D-aspartate/D-glutamate deacylase